MFAYAINATAINTNHIGLFALNSSADICANIEIKRTLGVLRSAFEGGSADELNNNDLIRQFYLGM